MQLVSVPVSSRCEALRQNCYFSALPNAALKALAEGTQLGVFSPGEPVFWQDEPCPGLFIVRRGSVKLFRLSLKGRELIFNVLFPGEAFNEVACFDCGKTMVNVVALEETELWIINPVLTRNAICENPETAQEVIQSLSASLRMFVTRIEELSFHQVTQRLARLLAELPEEQLNEDAGIRVTRAYLAARLGTVREMVARALKELERSGAITATRRQIRIMDHKILEELGKDSC